MKILVFSDTHGEQDKMCEITSRLARSGSVNYIIHLGDLVQDARFLRDTFPEIPIEYVCGNNDFNFTTDGDIAERYEKMREIGGKKILIAHGHTKGVTYSTATFRLYAKYKECDIALFGHTHIAEESYGEGIHFLNPGSLRSPRDGKTRSYGVITINDGSIETAVVRLR